MRFYPALVLALAVLPWPTASAAPPPESLDALYPPEAQTRIYTHEMLQLGRVMGALAADLQKGSSETRASLEAFAAQLERVASMVPEWTDRFPDPGFDRLAEGADTEAGRAAIARALAEVEASCTSCHMTDLFPVQARYHWPEFAKVTPADGSGRPVPFHTTMVELSIHMAALPVSVERRDWEAASSHHAEIDRQFELLEASCAYCHAEPRAYFVDEKVQGIVLFTGGMVRVRNVDASEYDEKMQDIESKSCIPCHQLHMPVAYMQMQLAQEK